MVLIKLLLLFSIICSCILAAPSVVNDSGTNSVHHVAENIMAAGYQAERHHVTTSDGYILEMQRIPFKRGMSDGDPARPVVFLMHGLMGASNGYIGLGAEYAIAYNLADSGCDVWMGNARGNRLSRFHVSMDADNLDDRIDFFDFTWEEIGLFDLPAMIDYALETSGRQQLHYLGHSQGGTNFLVLTSMRPEYNEKFASVHLLAGVGYKEYFPNTQLRTLAVFTTPIYNLAVSLGFLEIPPVGTIQPSSMENDTTSESEEYSVSDYCTGEPFMKELCVLIGLEEIIREDEPVETAGGASMKQIAHYGQNIRDRVFRRWDYGFVENLEQYGSINPPIYDLSLITADVTMHYTVNDNLLDERDVIAMANDMPNTVVRKVARETFEHVDFIAAIDVKELVTDYIIEYIWNVENSIGDIVSSESEDSSESDESPSSESEDSSVSDESPSTEEDSTEDSNEPDSSTSLASNIYLLISLLLVARLAYI